MKGLVVTEDNKLYLEEKLPIPEIGEYEALVKNECCMICNGTGSGSYWRKSQRSNEISGGFRTRRCRKSC
ncbi:MAG: hypothetical protein ACLR6B_12985 [Blautia sp.]